MRRNQSSFTDPLNNPTLDSFARAYLLARGIDPETTGRAARLASMTAVQVAEALDRKAEAASSSGLGIPYLDETGRLLLWRVRLQEGKTRFLVKEGEEMRPYFPPFLNQDRYQDADLPLVEVEGPVKACSLAAGLSLPTIGLGGVEVGGLRARVWKEAGLLELHPDILRRCALWGRRVVVVFDAGAFLNPLVALALAKRVAAYRAKGAKVYTVRLPLQGNGDDQGPDDFLAKHGPEKLKELLSSALLGDPLERFRSLLDLGSVSARSDALRALLDELPFRAALCLEGARLRNLLAAEAKAAGVDLGKTALKELADDFKRRLFAKRQEKEEKAEAQDERPEIQVTSDEHKVVEVALQVLGKSEVLYQRGRRLVTVARDVKPPSGVHRETGTPVIHPADRPLLRLLLSHKARFTEVTLVKGKAREKKIRPPSWLAEDIEALPGWEGIRPLTAVIEAPAFLLDGSILSRPGYDPNTGLLFMPNAEYAPIPENPSKEEIKEARVLLEEPFVDFLFESEAHASAVLSGVLTPLCRWSFAGNIPLHLIDANTRRAGKSLLADAVGCLVSGRGMARMTPSEDEAEVWKRLVALALAGDPLILLDNIPLGMSLGTGGLDAALTSRGAGLRDRALGSNERTVCAPWDAVVYATGNNVAIKEDTLARVLHIRLFVPMEKPEERSGFRHPKLLFWIKENRGRIVSAALTLARAWHLAGRPHHKGTPWGGFDEWGDIVRSILVFHGYADPGLTRQSLAEGKSSPERDLLSALLDGWAEIAGTGELTASEALSRLKENADEHAESKGALGLRYLRLREAFGLHGLPSGVLPTPKKLGRLLESHRKKVLGSKMLDSRPDRKGILLWRVETAKSFAGDQPAGFAGFCRDSPGTFAEQSSKKVFI